MSVKASISVPTVKAGPVQVTDATSVTRPRISVSVKAPHPLLAVHAAQQMHASWRSVAPRPRLTATLTQTLPVHLTAAMVAPRPRLVVTMGDPIATLRAAFGDSALAGLYFAGIGVTSGSGVASAFADARGVGFGAAWTFTSTAQPVYTKTAAGVWVLRLDGVNDGSDHNAGLASVFQNTGSGFAFVVASTVGTPAAAVVPLFVSGGNSTTAGRLVLQRNSSGATVDGFLRPTDGGSSKAIDGGVSDAVLRDDLFVLDLPNGATRLYQGGALTVQNAAAFTAGTLISNTPSLSVKLGKSNSANFFPGDIAAVVLGTVVPNATQIAALHAFGVAAGAAR